MTKQEYIEKIDNFMADCPDIVLLDLILKASQRLVFDAWEEPDSDEDETQNL